MMTFEEAVEAIAHARTIDDLGSDAQRTYRMLIKIVHPDVAPAGRGAAATQAAARLSALLSPDPEFVTRKARYRLGEVLASGDIGDVIALDDDKVLKFPGDPGDNDLMRSEATALETLERDGDPRHRAYAPRLIETFTHEDEDGTRRTANVLQRLDGFVSLAGLEHRLDPRDVAWMWRRLLTGLGWAHRTGLVHGAVLPEHVLIHPGDHGVVLVDWCYSVPEGGIVAAIVTRHRDAYPREILTKQPATAATDIFMATGLMLRLIDNPPEPMRRFAAGCRFDAPRMRPQDAWQLLAELDELLFDLYGPRRFRPFALPATR